MSHPACPPALHAGPAEAVRSRSDKTGQSDHGQIIRFCLPERDRGQVRDRSSPDWARGPQKNQKDYRKYRKTIVKVLSHQQPAFAGSRPDLFFTILSPPWWAFAGPGGGGRAAGRESLPQQKFISHVGFFIFAFIKNLIFKYPLFFHCFSPDFLPHFLFRIIYTT